MTLPWGTKIILTRGNFWQGEFTGKHGINSLADLKDEAKQELAIQDVWKNNYDYINRNLKAEGFEWKDIVNKTWIWKGEEVTFSLSGMVAASHLGGASATVDFLTGKGVASDETGTSVAFYFKEFGGRATPWGTTVGEVLDGNQYDNTFWSAGGSDTVTTHGGKDVINVVKGNPDSHDIVKVTDFDLTSDDIIFKGFTGPRTATVTEGSDGLRIQHSGNSSEVVLQGITKSEFDAAGGLSELIHYSNDYQMTWDGSIEGEKLLTGFDLDYDKLVAANGGAFKHLLVKGVYGADGQVLTKLTFAHDDRGWEGKGYLIDAEVSAVAGKLGTLLSGAWGDASEAEIRNSYEVHIQPAPAPIFGFLVYTPFVGSARNEDIYDLLQASNASLNGGGGSDTWNVQDRDISWYGVKRINIEDFAPESGDKLDLSDIAKAGAQFRFYESAMNGDSHVNIYRAGVNPELPLNLTFTQLSLHNPNGGGYYDWDQLISSGAVILA